MIRCHRLGGVVKSKIVASSSFRSTSCYISDTSDTNYRRENIVTVKASVSGGTREYHCTSICDKYVVSLRSSSPSSKTFYQSNNNPNVSLCYGSNPPPSSSLRTFASMSKMTKSFEDAIHTAKQTLTPQKHTNHKNTKKKPPPPTRSNKNDNQSIQAIYGTNKDKTKQTERRNELVGGAAIAGGVVGLVLSGPFVGLVAGVAAAGLAVANAGKVGDVARASADVVVNLDKKHQIVEKTTNAANLTVERAKELDSKHRVVEKTRNKVVKGFNFISKQLDRKV
mmetsp:Transcript_17986/g.21488  ORF Transcript_17986/g.21488 Transcript_17986/m.21488 type:complete len:281 (-) Transcript_17986:421-1263(-)